MDKHNQQNSELNENLNEQGDKHNGSDRQSKTDSSNEVDFNPDDQNQKFFNLADVKDLDLKSQWLGNTNEIIEKYEIKLSQLKTQKQIIKEGFKRFEENENRYKISSLRKLSFNLDKKEIYRQYMKKSRRPIQKIHPALIINIVSYTQSNIFLGLCKIRRVSHIFDYIYHNQAVIDFFSDTNFGYKGMPLEKQEEYCENYVNFVCSMTYYKDIQYTQLIPQNSIKDDLEKAVQFINDIYKRTYALKNLGLGYFNLVNKFMKKNRVVIGLSALSLTSLAIMRKSAIIAFSNYLAYNPLQRKRAEITKTKYLKVIKVVQDEDYRDSLIINTKISNFLQQYYNYHFAVIVDLANAKQIISFSDETSFDIVIYHKHNELKSFLIQKVEFEQGKTVVNGIQITFTTNLSNCKIYYQSQLKNEALQISGQYMPAIGRQNEFSHCYIYRDDEYYIILIKSFCQDEQFVE